MKEEGVGEGIDVSRIIRTYVKAEYPDDEEVFMIKDTDKAREEQSRESLEV